MAARRSLENLLQRHLDQAVREDPAVHGGILRVDAPGFAWQGAAGLADPAAALAMRPDDQFQAASITKMLTATTFMTLVEAGLADPDAAIGRWLPPPLTEELHEYEAGPMVPSSLRASCSRRPAVSPTSSVTATQVWAACCRS